MNVDLNHDDILGPLNRLAEQRRVYSNALIEILNEASTTISDMNAFRDKVRRIAQDALEVGP